MKQDKQSAVAAGKVAVKALASAESSLVEAYYDLGVAYKPLSVTGTAGYVEQAEFAALIGTSQPYVSRGLKLVTTFPTKAAAVKAYNAQEMTSVTGWVSFLGKKNGKKAPKKAAAKTITEKQASQRAMNASWFVFLPKEAQRAIIAAAK